MNWYKQTQLDESSSGQPAENPYIVYEHAGYEAFERDWSINDNPYRRYERKKNEKEAWDRGYRTAEKYRRMEEEEWKKRE